MARYVIFYSQVRPHRALDGPAPDRLYCKNLPVRPTSPVCLLKQITSRHEIPDDPAISHSWERLTRQAPLGRQYDWLARYAKSRGLTDLELSVHVDDKAHYFLKNQVEQTPFGTYKLRPGVTGDEQLFARFEFPILECSKTQMRELASKHGFIEVLEKSWFCHQPKHGVPCGTCSPCIYTIKEGMAYRLPPESMVRYHLNRCRKVLHSPWLLGKMMLSNFIDVLSNAHCRGSAAVEPNSPRW